MIYLIELIEVVNVIRSHTWRARPLHKETTHSHRSY